MATQDRLRLTGVINNYVNYGAPYLFSYIQVYLHVGRPSVYLPCVRRISMVTDDEHTVFAETIININNEIKL